MWKTKEKHEVHFSADISAGRGDTLSDDPAIQAIVDFLTNPLPNSEVNPTETLRGKITVHAEINRS